MEHALKTVRDALLTVSLWLLRGLSTVERYSVLKLEA
jgi:hypothetical protein